VYDQQFFEAGVIGMEQAWVKVAWRSKVS
jgi:hypothetical protein